MIFIFLYLENESKEDLFNQNQTSVTKQPEESWSVNPSIHKQVTFEFFSPWVYKKKKTQSQTEIQSYLHCKQHKKTAV